MPSRSFEDLTGWLGACQSVLDNYHFTDCFPDVERLGLASQLRRAGLSTPGSIAEASKRNDNPDKPRFCNMAQDFVEKGRCN